MSDVFRLLAEPSRRRLLEALLPGERSVGQLVDRTRMAQPSVSKQLRLMLAAGLVRLRRVGRQHLYSIRGAPLREASEWLRFYERYWSENLARLDEVLSTELPRKRRGRP